MKIATDPEQILRNVYTGRNVIVLKGLEDIGLYLGIHRNTVSRWIKQEGFPACQLPDRTYMTTPALIDAWIIERRQVQAIREA